ncbi:hypothetical protein AB0C15_03385 [Micromonospora sp. NPDC048835]|uniref:hypothetical protein n=1 Tax=Micromonospora sp. NPDC048835 TaxID=3155147 RepID=UPI0033CB0106
MTTTAQPFDPNAVAAAARGDEPATEVRKGIELSGADTRRILANMSGASEAPRPRYPLFPESFDRPEFAALAAAVAALDGATSRREDAQDAYQDAEDAYRVDLGAWERAQAETAKKIAAGAKVPAKIEPRPTPAPYEAKAELLARVAGEAVKAEARAAEAVNAECRKVGTEVARFAADRQRAMAEAVRPKLAEVLAEVGDLIEAHERAYAARTCETSDRLAAAQGWEPSRAYLRQNRDNAAFVVAQGFYSREVDRHEDAGKRGVAALRVLVDALAVENFAAPWPTGTDPVDAVRDRLARGRPDTTPSVSPVAFFEGA